MTYGNTPGICPRCGANTTPGAAFCAACGSSLQQASRQSPAVPPTVNQDATNTRNGAIGCVVLLLLLFVVLTPFGSCVGPSSVSTDIEESSPSPSSSLPYEIVGDFGDVKTVYMSPENLKDTDLVGRVLGEIVDESVMVVQVDFFDDRNATPGRYPMTDNELAHWRAQYTFSRQYNEEKFMYVTNGNSENPVTQAVPIRPIRE